MSKYLIGAIVILVVSGIAYVTAAERLARSQQMVLCYNAGYTYKCTFVPRGKGY